MGWCLLYVTYLFKELSVVFVVGEGGRNVRCSNRWDKFCLLVLGRFNLEGAVGIF